MEPTNVSINESMERYSLVRSFIKEWLAILFYRYRKRKQEWGKNATLLLKLGKIKKGGKKMGGNMIRLFNKLNIIIKVSFLHSLLIAKRGGCGLIELAQCLRRGVAEQDMPFVCTASAVWRILYERWNFVFSRMWRDGLRVVPWTTKGKARVTLLRFVERTIFLNREFGKKSFQLDRKQKIRRRIVFVLEIFPKKMQNFSFKVEARDHKFR